MNSARWRIGLLLCALLLIVVAVVILRSPDKRSAKRHSPELEYLKAVNSVAPPKDPELMFILMGEFASSNLQDEGAEFFSARLKEFEPQLTPVQKSLYLGIIGLLRAQNASRVRLLNRYGYVRDTIATLDQAKQASGGQVFVVNWIAGIVHTELPGFFHQRKAAHEELTWCAENADKAPHSAWLREVYFTGNTVLRRQSVGSCVCTASHRRDRARSRLHADRLRIHGILLRGFQGPPSTHQH